MQFPFISGLLSVYEWMVQNVPYFRDKGDSNSSAGWKVSEEWCLCLSKRVIYDLLGPCAGNL